VRMTLQCCAERHAREKLDLLAAEQERAIHEERITPEIINGESFLCFERQTENGSHCGFVAVRTGKAGIEKEWTVTGKAEKGKGSGAELRSESGEFTQAGSERGVFDRVFQERIKMFGLARLEARSCIGRHFQM